MADIVFIHGLWISYTAWRPWIEYFTANGHTAIAPRWPGEQQTAAATRENLSAQAGFGIAELCEHTAAVIEQFDQPPVAVGHSVGGLITQKLLEQNRVAAAVAIAPAPMKGVKSLPIAQLRSAFPVLVNPLNRGKAIALTKKQFRYGFGNALTEEESDALWRQWSVPSPGKPVFECAAANFIRSSPAEVDTGYPSRGPLLMAGGTLDHTVPLATAKAAFRLYAKSNAVNHFHEFDGAGHSLTIDHRWPEVADVVLTWLTANGFPGEIP
jgi:pimeloyl-ACP methyl ester carboxylesterase